MKRILIGIVAIILIAFTAVTCLYVANYETDFELLQTTITKNIDESSAKVLLSEIVEPYTAPYVKTDPELPETFDEEGIYEFEVFKNGILSRNNKKKVTIEIVKTDKQDPEETSKTKKNSSKHKTEVIEGVTDVDGSAIVNKKHSIPKDYDEQDHEETSKTKKNSSKHKTEVIEGVTYVDGIAIVNKKHSIPKGYAKGEDIEAVANLKQIISDMQAQGMNVSNNYSGYRSYEYQSQLYTNYVAQDGQKQADRYSARPGYSEHQLGLAFDLLEVNGNLLESEYEAKWLLDNAHKYGFIVRYQDGTEGITGYMPEAWHLRYVGKKHAEQIYKQGITLEEYLDVEGGDYVA